MMYLMADLGRQNRHLRIHIFEICTLELTFNACKLIAHVSRKRHHLLLFEVLARIWQQIRHNIDQTIQTRFRGAESSEAFISASKKLQLNAHILACSPVRLLQIATLLTRKSIFKDSLAQIGTQRFVVYFLVQSIYHVGFSMIR